MRRSSRIVAAAAMAGGFAVAASGAAEGAPGPVGGYGMSASAAPVRSQFASPGLLPVGDPRDGTIVETDVAFTRTTVSLGPLVDALASPLYPGDPAAHLGTAAATFGAPPLPNDPVVAEAQYPPSRDHGAAADFAAPQSVAGLISAGAIAAHASATDGGSTATASVATVALTPAATLAVPLVEVQAASAVTVAVVARNEVATTAVSRAARVVVAGVVEIDGVMATSTARSNGTRGTADATLRIGAATVAGHPVAIDETGVHAAGADVDHHAAAVQALVDEILAQDGVHLHLVAATRSVTGGHAHADAGGLAVTVERHLPAVSVAGLAPVTLPGVGALPAATPDLPLRVSITIGAASVDTNATTVPPSRAASLSPPPNLRPSEPPPGLPAPATTVGAEAVPAPSAAVPLRGAAVPARSDGPPRGSPVPVGWLVTGVLASLVLAGPLLEYARWQLLERRLA